MTDREKLIELIYESDLVCNKTLCEECDYLCSNRCKSSMTADHLLANGVTFAKDTNVPSWIPVSERLPEEWKEVLVLSEFVCCETAVYLGIPGKWRVTWNHNMLEENSITHWMPLPEPPKEENNA
jgi:hypothetical protein